MSLESSGSIIMEVHDVPAVTAAVRSVVSDAIIMIDSTQTADVLFKVSDFGIDVSVQAVTKYLVGHLDAMIGTAVCNVRRWEQLQENAYLIGQMADANIAYITSRGLRTLGVCLRQHYEDSPKVARQLVEYPQVARVNHPALPSNEGHEFWKRDSTGNDRLFSFVLRKKLNDEGLASYLGNFSSFSMTHSWGGYEPLILANQPEHIAVIRPQGEIDSSGTLIYLHIGLKDADDLIADLDIDSARIVQHCHFWTVLQAPYCGKS